MKRRGFLGFLANGAVVLAPVVAGVTVRLPSMKALPAAPKRKALPPAVTYVVDERYLWSANDPNYGHIAIAC